MREVTAAELPAQGLDEQITRAITAIEAGTEIARQAIEGRGNLIELLEWSARLADAAQDIRQAAMFTAVNEIALAAAPQPARRARARHARGRVPRQRAADGQIALFPPGGRLAGAVAAAFAAVRIAARHAARPVRHVLPHSWKAAIVAHKAAAVGLAVGATAVTATVGAMVIPAGVHAITAGGGTPAASAPGAPGLYGASPIPPDQAPAFTRAPGKTRTGKADTSSAGEFAVAPLPPLVTAPPASQPSSAQPSSPSPSFTPSYPPMSAPPAGQLQVSSGSIDVSSGRPQTITLTAAAGPVFWDADATGAGATDVVLTAARGDGTPLDRLQGWLMPGEQIVLTVTPSAAQDGSTQTTVDLGNGVAFTVTLVDPVPAASASVAPSPASS